MDISKHKVKKHICFTQWKQNSEFTTTKSLLRVVVTLRWYSSTHSISSNLRTVDFQTLANSQSALKLMLFIGSVHTEQSENLGEMSWFLISSFGLIHTWNFTLNYFLLSDFANWGCFGVPPSWWLGHTVGILLCGDQDMGFILYPCLNTSQLVSHAHVRTCWKWLWLGTGELKASSHTGHNCHHSSETPPAMPNTGSTAENCTFFLNSFSSLSQIPWECGRYSMKRDRQEWSTAKISMFLRRPSQSCVEGKWYDSTLGREEMKNTAKWSWINTTSPQDLNLLQCS